MDFRTHNGTQSPSSPSTFPVPTLVQGLLHPNLLTSASRDVCVPSPHSVHSACSRREKL